jgi:hypothetical protein
MAASFDIIEILWNVWHIGKDAKKVGALTKLQTNWRNKRISKLSGPYPSLRAVNDTDPFTMETLTDIDPIKIFSFWENSNNKWRLYAFDGSEFYEYVFVHGQQANPLTRVQIDYRVQSRLKQWNKHVQKQHGNAREQRTWQTPGVAFTDVATLFETHHGIYIQPQWFTRLAHTEIAHIVQQYTTSVSDRTRYIQRNVFPNIMELDTRTLQFMFATEIYNMLCEEVAPSYLVCNLVVAIASVCEPLNESIPDWVIDATYV